MRKTPVKELAAKIASIVQNHVPYDEWQKIIDAMEHAIHEERMVIEEAFHRGFMDAITIPRSDKFQNGEQYYEKNFK